MSKHKLKINSKVTSNFSIFVDICFNCGKVYDCTHDDNQVCTNCNTYSIQTITMGYSVFESMFEPEIVNNEILGKYIPIEKLEGLIFESNL